MPCQRHEKPSAGAHGTTKGVAVVVHKCALAFSKGEGYALDLAWFCGFAEEPLAVACAESAGFGGADVAVVAFCSAGFLGTAGVGRVKGLPIILTRVSRP